MDTSPAMTSKRAIFPKGFKLFEEAGLLGTLIVLFLIIGIPHPEFFDLGSIKTLLRQSAFVGIMAFGMVYLVSMTEIDLSVGGIYAVSAMSAALLIKAGLDPWLAALLALGIGTALGALNGIITVLLDVPLIIVSLGTLSVYFGLNLIISDASPVFGMPRDHAFFVIFGGEFMGLPAAAWVMFLCGIVLHLVFFRTRFGATVRAIGANRSAAEFIGIRVDRVRIYTCALTGFLSAVAGILALTYFRAIDPSAGQGKELQVIAAVVIGGTSLAGGSGTMLGALIGVLIITVIDSGIAFFGVDSNYANFVTGCVILAAIALDRVVKRRRQASEKLQSHI